MEKLNLNYCPECGSHLTAVQFEGRIRKLCSDCQRPVYRNPKPAGGVLVLKDEESILLVKRGKPPAIDTWSVPAGFLEIDETPREGAVRELKEETSITVTSEKLNLLTTTYINYEERAPVVVIIYVTRFVNAAEEISSGSDAADAKFWKLSKLRASEQTIEPGYESVISMAVS